MVLCPLRTQAQNLWDNFGKLHRHVHSANNSNVKFNTTTARYQKNELENMRKI